jgi:hypothetical protein
MHDVEGGFPFGFGEEDSDELRRQFAEFAEQLQAGQQRDGADNPIQLAVDMTVAAVGRVNVEGTREEQTQQLRAVAATVFPEAVALVREALESPQ